MAFKDHSQKFFFDDDDDDDDYDHQKKKMTKSKKNNFFLFIFWMNQSLLSPKKVVPNFFFFLRKLLTFLTFFLRPYLLIRLNMIYMKFEKKMLGGSDFFLDFLGPDLAKILGFGALRGQFWTIEIEKTPKLFRRPADDSMEDLQLTFGNYKRLSLELSTQCSPNKTILYFDFS